MEASASRAKETTGYTEGYNRVIAVRKEELHLEVKEEVYVCSREHLFQG